MATVQGEFGKVRLFEDFNGPEWTIAETAASGALGGGPFRVIGDGIGDTDSGITVDESTVPLNGVGIFTTTDEDLHTCGVATSKCFDVAKMAPMAFECRVQFADTDDKEFYFGLSDDNSDAVPLETNIISNDGANTFTLTATHFCGFYYSQGLTDDEDWHAVYHGGTTTGETNSTNVDLDEDIVAGEFQVLRLEVDPNGTARWYVDGALKKTLETAVSTTTDMSMVCLVSTCATTNEYAYVDYVFAEAYRDWTV